MKKLSILALWFFASTVYCVEESPSTQIEAIYSYLEFGNGDVVFTLNESSSTCFGYWLKSDSPGQQNTLSMLLSAYHAKSSIKVLGLTETANRWSGSSSHYCKVYAIIYGL